jgi:drug/metabolite transporter (DMT)-like permease
LIVASPDRTDAPLSMRQAVLLLGAVVALWGINWPIMKLGLQDVTPLWFAALRMVLAVVVYLPMLAVMGRLRLPGRGDLPIVFGVGIFQMGLFMGLMTYGLEYVDAGRSAVLAYTTPIWVAPGAVWLLGERLTPRKALGIALGVTGIAVLFNPLDFDWSDRPKVMGNAALVLSALMWAVSILQVRAHRWRLTPLEAAPWQCLVAAILLVPLAWALEGPLSIHWTPRFAAVLVYNVPITTCFAYWAIVTINRSLSAIGTSLSFLIVPVVGLVASTLWLGETPSPATLLGLAVICLGVATISLGDGGFRRR